MINSKLDHDGIFFNGFRKRKTEYFLSCGSLNDLLLESIFDLYFSSVGHI